MEAIIPVFVALALTTLAYWQRVAWLFLGATAVWIAMGVFGVTQNENTVIEYYLGWVYIGLGIITAMSPIWLKEKKEPPSDEEEEERKQYRRHLRDLNKPDE